ncbi:TnsA endonuclease N-terminal domain-containing protein [Vibrio vulnificus]|uniref:TnsA endonuclease N-terminal domain-containing protein n=1 Tax=Vibrio vulnificus TaxID=672 RepID=UPI00102A899B|nr:TnsA endonuclease N-terminal domain-containing protein [Vibrio vulnificus]EGQ8704438.1 heteromeric transposase endonuclease subunit TnsA [Vibrio parahaemolyticus]EGR3460807.1 heteromeric transposase endonuclease subunit TnsA [Vibrio parahaemolyticus]EJC7183358.1 TnsA endonuclease N-terminal domain-containing protein [Vibrio parahaemolyticus]EJG0060751.1 TnsA endonuclease N-terminal domain-containing protein [Vibrio parahaemolyticus]EJG0451313.1 TnsA endonuclease N-terminal domain-containing
MKVATQPLITKRELNRISKYIRDRSNGAHKPFITVRQSNSVGLSHIVFSHKTNRCHHLLSLGELALFLHLEHNPDVIDIHEQYPLPLDETLECAVELNIRHPAKYKERKGRKIPAATMTTDIVATLRDANGQLFLQPFNYKPSSSLDPELESTRKVSRTQQKFRIEQMYWERHHYQLIQVTENELHPNKTYNLQWLREAYHHAQENKLEESQFQNIRMTLSQRLQMSPKLTLKQHLSDTARMHNITQLAALRIFQHSTYSGQLQVDLNERIELFRTVKMVPYHDEN